MPKTGVVKSTCDYRPWQTNWTLVGCVKAMTCVTDTVNSKQPHFTSLPTTQAHFLSRSHIHFKKNNKATNTVRVQNVLFYCIVGGEVAKHTDRQWFILTTRSSSPLAGTHPLRWSAFVTIAAPALLFRWPCTLTSLKEKHTKKETFLTGLITLSRQASGQYTVVK